MKRKEPEEETNYYFDPVNLSFLDTDIAFDITRHEYDPPWKLINTEERENAHNKTQEMINTYYTLISSSPELYAYYRKTMELFHTVVKRDSNMSERLKFQQAYHDYLKNELSRSKAHEERYDSMMARLNKIEEKLDILMTKK